MSDENGTSAKTYSEQDYNKAVDRARNFEAKLVDLEKAAERFKGIDLDALKAAKEERDILVRKAAIGDDAKIQELITEKEREFEKRFGDKFADFETKLTASNAELTRLRVVNPAMLQAAEKFNSDALELIQGKIESACAYVDGKIVVKGADGKPLDSKLDPRRPMELGEYLDELVEKYPSCAKATGTAGAKDGAAKAGTTSSGRKYTLAEIGAMAPEKAKQIMDSLTASEAKAILG